MSDISGHETKKFFCMKCLLHFYSEESLKKHNIDYPNCSSNNNTAEKHYQRKKKHLLNSKTIKINILVLLLYMQILKVY